MDEAVRRLRARSAATFAGQAAHHVRYPVAFRRAAIAFTRMRLGHGGSVARLARKFARGTLLAVTARDPAFVVPARRTRPTRHGK